MRHIWQRLSILLSLIIIIFKYLIFELLENVFLNALSCFNAEQFGILHPFGNVKPPQHGMNGADLDFVQFYLFLHYLELTLHLYYKLMFVLSKFFLHYSLIFPKCKFFLIKIIKKYNYSYDILRWFLSYSIFLSFPKYTLSSSDCSNEFNSLLRSYASATLSSIANNRSCN